MTAQQVGLAVLIGVIDIVCVAELKKEIGLHTIDAGDITAPYRVGATGAVSLLTETYAYWIQEDNGPGSDSLGGVAAWVSALFGGQVSIAALRSANALDDDSLHTGQVLAIPLSAR